MYACFLASSSRSFSSFAFIYLDTLQDVQSRCLLYPSAGTDWETALVAFHPWIESFWFVDTRHKESAKLKELCDSVDLIEINALEGRTIKGNPAPSGDP